MTYESNRRDVKILFVEAETWERDSLSEKCLHGCDMHAESAPMEDVPDEAIPEGTSVLSPFIHSRVDKAQLDRLPELRMIATRSTGYDHIDIEECDRRGIIVSNVPEYGDNTVAEHAFALLLALTRKVHRCYDRTIRGDFSIEGLRGTDLMGKTFGALGTGKIARRALRIAGGFGMRRIAYDIKPDPIAAADIGFEYVSFEQLLAQSNVLSIHVPYNDKTHHLVNADALDRLPEGAFVVNTARGGIVDPDALVKALQSGHLGGAALDVLQAERSVGEEAELLSSSYDVDTLRSVVQSHALLRMPNVIITPHVGFNSTEAVQRIIQTTVDNIEAFRNGRPQNVVGNVDRVSSESNAG
jgi:D-lactate dehydrogenase